MSSLRSAKLSKRYEYYSYELDTPLQTAPAYNTYQKKDGYKFTVNAITSSDTVADWYNAYFEMDFKITKMDDTEYVAANAAATINGGFSLIKDIKAGFESARVLDLSNGNHVTNVKNLTEFSEEHSKRVGPRQFYYPDTATGAVIQKYSTIQLDGNAGPITPTDNTNYNKGFTKRKTRTQTVHMVLSERTNCRFRSTSTEKWNIQNYKSCRKTKTCFYLGFECSQAWQSGTEYVCVQHFQHRKCEILYKGSTSTTGW